MPTNEKRKQADFLREQAIFLAAVKAGPEDRKAILDAECGDTGLRQRVEALLAAHDADGSLPPAAPPLEETQAFEAAAGAMIAGKYKLLEEIGYGGMGVVWMAEQRTPVRRLVALKLIKAGMDSRTVIARFEAERQALAMMDHPNIARVFDGGITEQGRPYFAMELVRGLPITQYCDQRRMTVRDRLLLFIQVCHAVQHAHQKGIIHRDIKPSNVLVTEHDAQPVPKVIDFGLAKAIGGTGVLTEHTVFTGFGRIAGTPLYTAPEQVAINSIDVDTRVDVYALGVLLYELITGSTPLDRERLKQAAWDEVCRVIREEEPPRPSARVSTSALLANLAASRHTEPAKLCGLIRGDLDWIVLKALDKERRLRYDTATALVADIERHLNDEPVVAAPPTAGYRARKFVRKHRTGAFVGAVIAALLLLGLASTTWQWRRADSNAATALQNERKAEIQRNVAETQKTEADNQRDAAETEAYIANIALGQAAMQSDNWPEARRRLSLCAESKRGFEWRFLWEKAQSIVACLPEGYGLSPDKRLWLARASADSVQLWDLAGNRVGKPMAGEAPSPSELEIWGNLPTKTLLFCANGRSVATRLKNQQVQLWDRAGKRVGPPLDNTVGLEASFSSDGRLVLTVPNRRTVQLCDVSGQPVGEPMRHDADVKSVAFDPDGTLVLTVCNDGTARLWDRAGKPVGKVMREDGGIYEAKFTPDGKLLVTQSSGDVARFRNRAGEPVGKAMRRRTHERTLKPPSFLPADRALYTAEGKSDSTRRFVECWDANGKPLGVWSGLESDEALFGISPDGQVRLAFDDDNSTARFRDHDGNPVGEAMQNERGIDRVLFSPDSKLVFTASGGAGVGRLWDLKGRPVGEPMLWERYASDEHLTVSFSKGGRRIAVYCLEEIDFSINWNTAERLLYVWDIQGKPIGSYQGLPGFLIDEKGSSLIADGVKPRVLRLDRMDSPVVSFPLDAALARDESAALDAAARRQPAPSAAKPHRTARRVEAGDVVELAAPGAAPLLLRHDQHVTAAAVSPDGSRAVTAAGGLIRFWDTASGREMAEIPADGDVLDLQFTCDGARLILVNEVGCEIWDSRPFEERHRDQDLRFSEFRPGREYAEQLLATATPNNRLEEVTRTDMSLNAIRKVQALGWLRKKLNGIQDRAWRVVFDRLKNLAVSRNDLREVLAEAHCTPRVSECVVDNIDKWWDEPNEDVRLERAKQVFLRPNLRHARYAAVYECVTTMSRGKPETADSLRTLGMGTYRIAKYEESVKKLTRSLELTVAAKRPADRTVLAFLAMGQFRLGRLDQARETLAKMRASTGDSGYEAHPEVEAEAASLIESASKSPAGKPAGSSTNGPAGKANSR
jgi:eukaryotic-like serine/threonine-protein kinase